MSNDKVPEKKLLCSLLGKLQNFQMKYFVSLQLKGLQTHGVSNFEVQTNLNAKMF